MLFADLFLVMFYFWLLVVYTAVGTVLPCFSRNTVVCCSRYTTWGYLPGFSPHLSLPSGQGFFPAGEVQRNKSDSTLWYRALQVQL